MKCTCFILTTVSPCKQLALIDQSKEKKETSAESMEEDTVSFNYLKWRNFGAVLIWRKVDFNFKPFDTFGAYFCYFGAQNFNCASCAKFSLRQNFSS